MDLGSLGINSTLVIGIVSITEVIKKFDKNNKLKNFYVIIPFLFGIGASFLMTKPYTATDLITNAIIYAGVSSYMYTSGKLALKKDTHGEQE